MLLTIVHHSDKTICYFLTLTYVLATRTTFPRHFYPLRKWNYQSDSPQVNRLNSTMFELDVWSQYHNPEEGCAEEGDILRRSDFRKTMTNDDNLLWPNGIVYYFIEDTIADEPKKLAILEDVMNNIMKLTCVRFVRIYPDFHGKFPLVSWVNISGSDKGCYSDLGRQEFSPSSLNLDVKRCFRTKGHAIHEILHTLGAYHEHMRRDRDKHIVILWDNIRDGDDFNFRVVNETAATDHGLPYDYDSVMHYSMTAFSKDKSMPTIIPRKKGVIIGQRSHLSFYDIEKLLLTYECKDAYVKYHQYKHANIDYENISESGKYGKIR